MSDRGTVTEALVEYVHSQLCRYLSHLEDGPQDYYDGMYDTMTELAESRLREIAEAHQSLPLEFEDANAEIAWIMCEMHKAISDASKFISAKTLDKH